MLSIANGNVSGSVNPFVRMVTSPSSVQNGSNGTYRGPFSGFFNSANIALEDWQRAEQAQDNQLLRDLYFQNKANEFNASEAEKQRAYDREMSSSQYRRAIEDMKIAGINPVLAVQHGASFAGGTSASSGGSRTSTSNSTYAGSSDSDGVAGMLLSIAAGLITKGVVKKPTFGFGK